jgi:hypothetical protein
MCDGFSVVITFEIGKFFSLMNYLNSALGTSPCILHLSEDALASVLIA